MKLPRKFTLNAIVDSTAFILFAFLTTTGVLMRFLLPPGSGRGKAIWGMDRHDWGNLHFWIAITLFAIMAIHLILHWRWIINALKGKKGKASGPRFFIGLFGLLMVILLSIAPLVSPVEVDQEFQKYKIEHKYEKPEGIH